ncbi:hypothetical protein DYST_02484 [Dyella terrae]|nr:hypothetical protein DYST_02484 [Dyella terrae]
MTFRPVVAIQRPGSPAAGFRPPTGGRVTFLCLPKKSNPKKGHPHLALAGEAGQFVRGGRAFRQGFLPWRKGIGILADPPCGPFRPPLTAAQGARRSKAPSRRLVQRSCTSHCGRSRCSCSDAQSRGRGGGRCPNVASSPQRSRGIAKTALSPLRYGALRSASKYPLCSGKGCQAATFLTRSGLSHRHAAGVGLSGHFFGLLFFGPTKKSDSSVPRD